MKIGIHGLYWMRCPYLTRKRALYNMREMCRKQGLKLSKNGEITTLLLVNADLRRYRAIIGLYYADRKSKHSSPRR